MLTLSVCCLNVKSPVFTERHSLVWYGLQLFAFPPRVGSSKGTEKPYSTCFIYSDAPFAVTSERNLTNEPMICAEIKNAGRNDSVTF